MRKYPLILIGCLFSSWPALASQIVNPASTAGFAMLAATQTWTGTQSFYQPILGSTSDLMGVETFGGIYSPHSGMRINSAGFISLDINGQDTIGLEDHAWLPDIDNTVDLGATAFGFRVVYMDSGSATTPSYNFANETNNNTGMYLIGENRLGFSAGGVTRIDMSNSIQLTDPLSFTNTSQYGVVGSTLADNAAAGNVGEYISSSTVLRASTGSNQYFTVAQITLSAGDWDLSGMVTFDGTSVTASVGGIGTGSGNSSSGLVAGDTSQSIPPPTAAYDTGVTIATVRASISGSTTYYLKSFMTFSGSAFSAGRISARRVR